MSKAIEIIILARKDLAYKDSETCYDWEIDVDYINNNKSKFTTKRNLKASQGDFLLVKLEAGKYTKVLKNERIKPFYVGIVNTNENEEEKSTIETALIYNLANVDFPATKKSGSSVQAHLLTLLSKYVTGDVTKLTGAVSVRTEGVDAYYSYQPDSSPTITNLAEYFIHMFEKTGVIWEVEWFGVDDNGKTTLSTVIHKTTKTFQIKNNAPDFQNWSVYVQEDNQVSENMLLIIDKTTNNSENPKILSTWYIDQTGTVTQDSTNVTLPTKSAVYLYDTTATDKPSYLEVARSELSVTDYAHEIKCDVSETSELLGFYDFEIGRQTALTFDDKRYNSMLTGYSMNSDDCVFSLTFGNIRSTIKSLLRG